MRTIVITIAILALLIPLCPAAAAGEALIHHRITARIDPARITGVRMPNHREVQLSVGKKTYICRRDFYEYMAEFDYVLRRLRSLFDEVRPGMDLGIW